MRRCAFGYIAAAAALLPGGLAGGAFAAEAVATGSGAAVSELAPLASHSLLIAIATAGQRLVAVGDRGHILWSDDEGRTWTQAAGVPTRALLTGVCFSDASHGIAVGHDEVALTTSDAGQHWSRTHYAPQAQQPLLDVWCGPGGRAIAVGAYNTYLSSEDGGASWSERKFAAQPLRPAAKSAATPATKPVGSGAKDADQADDVPGGGYHLNRIVGPSASRLYIAAEAGHLYRSDDGGSSWVELPSPYEGSFFGVLPLAGDALLAYGLRGNLFRSQDAGASWERIETGTVAMLDGGVSAGQERVAVVGLSGVVLVSQDAGKSFRLLQQADRKGLSAATVVGGKTLVTVGEAGVKSLTGLLP